jgi:hypothetical protein
MNCAKKQVKRYFSLQPPLTCGVAAKKNINE